MESNLVFYATALEREIAAIKNLVSAKQPNPKKAREHVTALILVTSLLKFELKQLSQVK